MGAVLQPGDIVDLQRAIVLNRNGTMMRILAGTRGIVTGENSKRKIGVQFELLENKTTPTIRCFGSNLRKVY